MDQIKPKRGGGGYPLTVGGGGRVFPNKFLKMDANDVFLANFLPNSC